MWNCESAISWIYSNEGRRKKEERAFSEGTDLCEWLKSVCPFNFLKIFISSFNDVDDAVKKVEREIADRIENPLEEGTPLFQCVFERCLSS